MEKIVGVHLLVELYGCDPSLIADAEVFKEKIEKIAKEAELTVLKSYHHQFHPYGVTSLMLLAESHLFVHTWPEYNYIAADIFTCGDERKAYKALELMIKEFKAKDIKKIEIKRGIFKEECVKVSP